MLPCHYTLDPSLASFQAHRDTACLPRSWAAFLTSVVVRTPTTTAYLLDPSSTNSNSYTQIFVTIKLELVDRLAIVGFVWVKRYRSGLRCIEGIEKEFSLYYTSTHPVPPQFIPIRDYPNKPVMRHKNSMCLCHATVIGWLREGPQQTIKTPAHHGEQPPQLNSRQRHRLCPANSWEGSPGTLLAPRVLLSGVVWVVVGRSLLELVGVTPLFNAAPFTLREHHHVRIKVLIHIPPVWLLG
jgi:hypothetical protein